MHVCTHKKPVRPCLHAQVLSILSSKLAALPWPVFQQNALELAARKVSSTTGDLRKVFQVRAKLRCMACKLTSASRHIRGLLDVCACDPFC